MAQRRQQERQFQSRHRRTMLAPLAAQQDATVTSLATSSNTSSIPQGAMDNAAELVWRAQTS
eukprot:4577221-Amphidinium_carterae.2